MKWRKSEISPPDRPRYRTYTPNGIAPRSGEDQKPGFCENFRIPTEIVKETRYETPTGISYGL
ncbi:MAG: hypothetical protein EBE86_000725 [Hormoscilla sp. GUM202]|nr:hypothetical protein [Hormoscilla sp. GUM202]